MLPDPSDARDAYAVTRHGATEGRLLAISAPAALGTCATAILRASIPTSTCSSSPGGQADMARRLGATVIAHLRVVGHRGSGRLVGRRVAGERRVADGLSRRHRRRLRHGRQAGNVRSGDACSRRRARWSKRGVHGPTWWEDTPLYFKEISMVGSNARVRDGERSSNTASSTYLDLVGAGTVDLTGLLTHTYTLDDWRDAFTTIDPGRHRRDQSRLRLPERRMSDPVVLTRDRRPCRGHHAEPAGSAERAEPGGSQAAPQVISALDADDDAT